MFHAALAVTVALLAATAAAAAAAPAPAAAPQAAGASDAAAAGPVAVFASRQEGYHTFRIPALMVTPRGTVLAFAEGRKTGSGDAGDIDLVLKRSTDGGRTWGPLQVIWDDDANTCGNPCPVVDEATGAVRLLMTWNFGSDSESAISGHKARDTRRVFLAHSTDDGATWTAPADITAAAKKPDWTWYATGPGVGIQLRIGPHKGRLVVPCDFRDAGGMGSHVILSDDGGRTWRIGGVVHPKVNECQVIERADGTLLLNMRSYAGRACRDVSTSADAGETWTPAAPDAALPEPVCQASLIRAAPPDAPGPPVVLFSNPADPKSRVRMTLRASLDDGRTWPVARVLHEGPAAYSCLAILPGGDAACLFEGGEKNAYQTILMSHVNMAELLRTPPGGR